MSQERWDFPPAKPGTAGVDRGWMPTYVVCSCVCVFCIFSLDLRTNALAVSDSTYGPCVLRKSTGPVSHNSVYGLVGQKIL